MDKFEKFKDGILNSLGFIAVATIVAIFFARSFVDIGATGKTVAEIIADGIFSLLFGWGIKVLLGYQGILSGMNTSKMKTTIEKHGSTVIKIEPYSPHLQEYCDKRNAELRIRKRRLILSKQLLHYEDVFCDDPTRLNEVIQENLDQMSVDNTTIDAGDLRSKLRKAKVNWQKHRKRRQILRCVKKANNVRFTELTQSALTTDGGNGDNPFHFPATISKHMTKKGVLSLPIAMMFAVIFGYYGYELIRDPDWANVIGGLIQIGALLGLGTLQFLKEFLYTTDTYRKGTVRKIDILEQFYQEACSNGGRFVIPDEIIKVKKIEPAQPAQQEEIKDGTTQNPNHNQQKQCPGELGQS